MPGDLAGVVAREIAQLQGLPQGLFGARQRAVQRQDLTRLLPPRLEVGIQVGPRAAQCAQRQAVQVFQQFALPGIPHLGAGAADVGHRQQVKRGQAAHVAHLGREGAYHVGVGQVFLLCHRAHGQVMLDQELDQRAVVAADPMVAAEAAHLARAQQAVVATAALGHVVEQRGHVQQPGLVPVGRQLRAERVLVGMLGDEEAPHVAQHHQDVLVHRVHMEQVVLHAADDAAEHPQVAAQHRGLVHQPEGVGDALRLTQQVHEQLAVDGVAPERRVHHVAGVVQRPQRARRQPLDARRLCEHQEGLEDGMRRVDVQVVARHLQHAAAVVEHRVDAAHRRGFGAADALLDVQHQDLVELGHRLGGPVVAVHQLLGRTRAVVVLQPEAVGHRGLQVEHQPVLAPSGHRVQPGADQRQRAMVALQLLFLERRDQPAGRQLGPAAAQPGGARHPDHHLQVAQAARAFLAVRLQGIRRVFVLHVALAHLQRLGGEEGCRVEHRFGGVDEVLEQPLVAGHQARLEYGRLHGHLAPRFGHAFAQRAHRRADLDAGVPAGGDEGLDAGLQRAVGVGVGAVGQQHQHVDIAVGQQLATAVATDCHQRHLT
jgi:hypothetical protein